MKLMRGEHESGLEIPLSVRGIERVIEIHPLVSLGIRKLKAVGTDHFFGLFRKEEGEKCIKVLKIR